MHHTHCINLSCESKVWTGCLLKLHHVNHLRTYQSSREAKQAWARVILFNALRGVDAKGHYLHRAECSHTARLLLLLYGRIFITIHMHEISTKSPLLPLFILYSPSYFTGLNTKHRVYLANVIKAPLWWGQVCYFCPIKYVFLYKSWQSCWMSWKESFKMVHNGLEINPEGFKYIPLQQLPATVSGHL